MKDVYVIERTAHTDTWVKAIHATADAAMREMRELYDEYCGLLGEESSMTPFKSTFSESGIIDSAKFRWSGGGYSMEKMQVES